MTQDVVALIAGALLAMAAMAYVLYPLFVPPRQPTPRTADVTADPIEARVRALRESHLSCPACGVRPEPDAQYCSSCGRFLGAAPTAR